MRLDSPKRECAIATEIRPWSKSVWLGCAIFLPSRAKEQQRHGLERREVLTDGDGVHGRSSKRHFHGAMADVKVWIVGEKVGEGVGGTRKEAQTTIFLVL